MVPIQYLDVVPASTDKQEQIAPNQGQGVSIAGESALQDGIGALEVRTELANERVVIIRTPIHRQALTTVLASLEALEC